MSQEVMQTPRTEEEINYIVKLNNRSYLGEGNSITANINKAKLFISDREAIMFATALDGVVYEVKATMAYKELLIGGEKS